MAEVLFDNPPNLQGEEKEQLQQLYAYLGIMSEKLNQALMSVSIEQMAPETQRAIRYAAEIRPEEQLKTTKELIIKTAQIVRTEMDELRTTLTQTIDAQSEEYGQLLSTLTNQVEANATGIQQNFARIEGVQGDLGEVEQETTTWRRYIKVGTIREDPLMVGVSIGKDNEVYATFTENALTFYQGDINNPVAYFASSVFYITKGEVTDRLKIGNHYWKVLQDGGLALIAGSGN